MTRTLQVHHDFALIARIAQQTTVIGNYPKIADGEPLTFSTNIWFSGYGTPVKVTLPPAAAIHQYRP